MVQGLKQLAYALSLRSKSRARIEAENLVLRRSDLIFGNDKDFQFPPPSLQAEAVSQGGTVLLSSQLRLT